MTSVWRDEGNGKYKESPTSRPAIEYQAEISQSLITEAVCNRLCCSSNVGPVSMTGTFSMPCSEGKENAAANGPNKTAGSSERSGAGLTLSCFL